MNEELLTSLQLNPLILKRLIQQISQERLTIRRKKNAWTIYEHVAHLEKTQKMLIKRLELFLTEEVPHIVPYNPDTDSKELNGTFVTIDDVLASFTQSRHRQIELIQSAPEKTWQKKAIHPEYNDYSYEILVRHILLHDSFHFYRIEELWLVQDEYLSDL